MVPVWESQPGSVHPVLVRQSGSGQTSVNDLRLSCKEAVHILVLLLWEILLLRLHILWVLLGHILWVLLGEVS